MFIKSIIWIKFKFQRSLANGAFVNKSVGGRVTQEIKGRTADLYQRQFEFDISNISEDDFPVRFKIVRTSENDIEFMNDSDNDKYISHVSKIYVTSHSLIKEQSRWWKWWIRKSYNNYYFKKS